MTSRILLVEDEEHLAFTLTFNLQSEGYHVDHAATLQDGSRLLLSSPPYHLLLLDVMLPDGESFSFCHSLRLHGDHTPILFLTAKGSPEDIIQGLDAGGDDYIRKPFVLKELLARIVAILRRQAWKGHPLKEERPREVRFGHTVVDLERSTVHVQGRLTELTALEFRLLLFFFEHEDQIVTREELLKHVWEVSSAVATRTMDNFLMRLRRLFEEDPAKPRHFLTIRGLGFRFLKDPSRREP